MHRTATASLVLLLTLPTASALIVTQPSRFDLGDLSPGGSFEGVVNVTNKGTTPERVEVSRLALEAEGLEADPSTFSLAPGESRLVTLRLTLPANASGGRHDPRVEFVELGEEGGTTVGRAAVSVPLVFRVQNLKVGNLEVRHAPPGEDAEARVLVQNFLDAATEADVTLRVLDAHGNEAARAEGRAARAEPNASTSLNVTLPTARLKPGAYSVEASASSGAHGSNARLAPLLVGERRLALSDADARVGKDGRATFTARVTNEGTVPLPAVVAFRFGPRDVPARTATADAGLLEPGASRVVTANATLAPGDHAWSALVQWPGDGEAQTKEATLRVAAPATPGATTPAQGTPVPLVVPVAALLLAGLARGRRRPE